MEDVIEAFPAAAVLIQADGPPTYVGHRVIVTGDPDGFRWLAGVLLKMAEDVDNPSKPTHIGWHLLLNNECAAQLSASAAPPHSTHFPVDSSQFSPLIQIARRVTYH